MLLKRKLDLTSDIKRIDFKIKCLKVHTSHKLPPRFYKPSTAKVLPPTPPQSLHQESQAVGFHISGIDSFAIDSRDMEREEEEGWNWSILVLTHNLSNIEAILMEILTLACRTSTNMNVVVIQMFK